MDPLIEELLQEQEAENALEQNLHLLPILLDSLAEGVFWADQDGICKFVNRAFLEILGYRSTQQLVGFPIHELIQHTHADGSPYPASESLMFKAQAEFQEVHCDTEVFWRADGSQVPVEYHARPLLGDEGTLGSIVTFTDIAGRLEAEQRLRDEAQKTHAIISSMVDGLITFDADGKIISVNPAAEQMFGYTKAQLIGEPHTFLFKGGLNLHGSRLIPHHFESELNLERALGINNIIRAIRPGGEVFPVAAELSEVTYAGRIETVALFRDVSRAVNERVRLEQQNEELRIHRAVDEVILAAETPKALLTGVLNAMIEMPEIKIQSKAGVFLVDSIDSRGQRTLTRPNPTEGMEKGLRLAMTLGHFSGEFLGREAWIPMGACLCGRSAVSGEVIVSSNCFNDPAHEHQFEGMVNHGHYIIPLSSNNRVQGVIFLYTDPDPNWDQTMQQFFASLGIQIGTALDHLWTQEELKHSREALYQQAVTDHLTGLPNRRALEAELERSLSRAAREKRLLGIVMMDLDGFKPINDTYGHDAGDLVLVEIARRLIGSLREHDFVARMGGDEFVVVIDGCSKPEQVTGTLERLERAIRQPIRVNEQGVEVSVGTSAGIALYPQLDERVPEKMLRYADEALYRAKAQKSSRTHFWVMADSQVVQRD